MGLALHVLVWSCWPVCSCRLYHLLWLLLLDISAHMCSRAEAHLGNQLLPRVPLCLADTEAPRGLSISFQDELGQGSGVMKVIGLPFAVFPSCQCSTCKKQIRLERWLVLQSITQVFMIFAPSTRV